MSEPIHDFDYEAEVACTAASSDTDLQNSKMLWAIRQPPNAGHASLAHAPSSENDEDVRPDPLSGPPDPDPGN